MRLRVLLPCLLVAAFVAGVFAMPSSGQSLNELEGKIDATPGKIGRKKGPERVLTGDITAYTRRINGLRVRISGLQRGEVTIQAGLDAKKAELAVPQARLR